MPCALPPSLAQRVPRRSKAMPFAAGTPVANTVAAVDAVPGRSTRIVSFAGALPPVTYTRPSEPSAMPLGEQGPGRKPIWVAAFVAVAILHTGHGSEPAPRSAT